MSEHQLDDGAMNPAHLWDEPDLVMDDECVEAILKDFGDDPWKAAKSLVDNYVGLELMSQLVASWLACARRLSSQHREQQEYGLPAEGRLQDDSQDIMGGARDTILDVLCLILERCFDPEKLRQFMMDHSDGRTAGWRPPQFYWQLMKTPQTAQTLKALSKKDRRSEFLHAFSQDFLALESRRRRGWKITKDPGSITSNFTIFSQAFSEVLWDFLIQEDPESSLECTDLAQCALLCHAENSYLYSQAVLHFIPKWRPDLGGCRRLSQMIYRYVREVRQDPNVADLTLLFTSIGDYPELAACFSALQRQDLDMPLNQVDVSALSQQLTKVLSAFERYQTLLYSRRKKSSPTKKRRRPPLPSEDTSSYGGRGKGKHPRAAERLESLEVASTDEHDTASLVTATTDSGRWRDNARKGLRRTLYLPFGPSEEGGQGDYSEVHAEQSGDEGADERTSSVYFQGNFSTASDLELRPSMADYLPRETVTIHHGEGSLPEQPVAGSDGFALPYFRSDTESEGESAIRRTPVATLEPAEASWQYEDRPLEVHQRRDSFSELTPEDRGTTVSSIESGQDCAPPQMISSSGPAESTIGNAAPATPNVFLPRISTSPRAIVPGAEQLDDYRGSAEIDVPNPPYFWGGQGVCSPRNAEPFAGPSVPDIIGTAFSTQDIHTLCKRVTLAEGVVGTQLGHQLVPAKVPQAGIALVSEGAKARCRPVDYMRDKGRSQTYANQQSVCQGEVIQEVSLPPLRLRGFSDLEEDIGMAPASQVADGDIWEEEYERLRHAPEVPPMDALRDGVLIDALLRDFASPTISLSPSALPLYIELILNLTTFSPYELLVKQAEDAALGIIDPTSRGRGLYEDEQNGVEASMHFNASRALPGHWTVQGSRASAELDVESQEEIDDPLEGFLDQYADESASSGGRVSQLSLSDDGRQRLATGFEECAPSLEGDRSDSLTEGDAESRCHRTAAAIDQRRDRVQRHKDLQQPLPLGRERNLASPAAEGSVSAMTREATSPHTDGDICGGDKSDCSRCQKVVSRRAPKKRASRTNNPAGATCAGNNLHSAGVSVVAAAEPSGVAAENAESAAERAESAGSFLPLSASEAGAPQREGSAIRGGSSIEEGSLTSEPSWPIFPPVETSINSSPAVLSLGSPGFAVDSRPGGFRRAAPLFEPTNQETAMPKRFKGSQYMGHQLLQEGSRAARAISPDGTTSADRMVGGDDYEWLPEVYSNEYPPSGNPTLNEFNTSPFIPGATYQPLSSEPVSPSLSIPHMHSIIAKPRPDSTARSRTIGCYEHPQMIVSASPPSPTIMVTRRGLSSTPIGSRSIWMNSPADTRGKSLCENRDDECGPPEPTVYELPMTGFGSLTEEVVASEDPRKLAGPTSPLACLDYPPDATVQGTPADFSATDGMRVSQVWMGASKLPGALGPFDRMTVEQRNSAPQSHPFVKAIPTPTSLYDPHLRWKPAEAPIPQKRLEASDLPGQRQQHPGRTQEASAEEALALQSAVPFARQLPETNQLMGKSQSNTSLLPSGSIEARGETLDGVKPQGRNEGGFPSPPSSVLWYPNHRPFLDTNWTISSPPSFRSMCERQGTSESQPEGSARLIVSSKSLAVRDEGVASTYGSRETEGGVADTHQTSNTPQTIAIGSDSGSRRSNGWSYERSDESSVSSNGTTNASSSASSVSSISSHTDSESVDQPASSNAEDAESLAAEAFVRSAAATSLGPQSEKIWRSGGRFYAPWVIQGPVSGGGKIRPARGLPVGSEYITVGDDDDGRSSATTIFHKILDMKSTVESSVFKGAHRGESLGMNEGYTRQIDARRTRKRFRAFQREVESYKSQARGELFELYRIARDPLVSNSAATLALFIPVTQTSIAASVAVAYLEHVTLLGEGERDPLLRANPAVLTFMKIICKRHPKKRSDILRLLHRCFQESHEYFSRAALSMGVGIPVAMAGETDASDGRSDRGTALGQCKQNVFAFLMWLLGMGFFSGVLSFLQLHLVLSLPLVPGLQESYPLNFSEMFWLTHVDRALMRRQLELVFGFCRPPFSPAFVQSLIRLLNELLHVQSERRGVIRSRAEEIYDFADEKNQVLRNLIKGALANGARAWAPEKPPEEITAAIHSLEKKLMQFKKATGEMKHGLIVPTHKL